MPTSTRGRTALVYALALLPAFALLRAVDLNAVSVPFMDDWQFVPLIEQVRGGDIPWKALVAPHDEHRLLIPRVLIIATTILSGGNYRAQCFLTVAVVAALSLALLFLLRRSLGPGRPAAVAWLLANLVLFSPIQWHNWLWPMQFAYFLPFTFLGLALAAWYSDLGTGARHALALLAAWAATWSFIQGLLLWPVLVAVVLRDARYGSTRERRIAGAGWAFSGLLAGFLYLHGLWQNSADPSYAYLHEGVPPTSSTLALLRADPLGTLGKMGQFALAMFGNALGRGFPVESNLRFAMAVGLVLLVAGVAFWVVLARRGRLDGARFAFAALFAHGFLTAALVGLGRVWNGPGQPLTPRYATFGTFCLLPVVLLGCLVFASDAAASPAEGAGPGPWRTRLLVACGILVGMLGVNWAYGLAMMGEWRDTQLVSRTGVHFALKLRSSLLSFAGGRPKFLRGRIEALDRLGYWDPPLAPSLRLDQFRIGRALPRKRGRIERVRDERGVIEVDGYARFSLSGDVPQAVLVTSPGADAAPEIRSLCQVYSPPRWQRHAFMRDYEFVDRALTPAADRYGRFHCKIRRGLLPDGDVGKLQLWALDFPHRTVRRLHEELDPMQPVSTPW